MLAEQSPFRPSLLSSVYEQLGSPRLSTLMEERCLPVGHLHEKTPRASEVNALVLERTPLFLFERKQMGRSEIKHDIDWLKKSLEVVEVDGEGLRLTRILSFGQMKESNVQKSSAMAAMRNGKLVLYLAMNLEIDWFEVADSISKFLVNSCGLPLSWMDLEIGCPLLTSFTSGSQLSRARLQEVLLFMNMLSTSLRNLKRRGFHVDKILSQRKAERDAADQAAREARVQAELRALEMKAKASDVARWKKEILKIFQDQDEAHLEKLLNSKSANHVEEVMQDILNGKGKTKEVKGSEKAALPPAPNSQVGSDPTGNGGFLSKWRGRLGGGPDRNSSLAMGTSSIESIPGLPGGFNQQSPNNALTAAGRSSSDGGPGGGEMFGGNGDGGAGGGQMVKGSPAAQPTSQEDIKSKALQAVQASRPDQSTSMTSTAQEQQVKEAASYCDITGTDMDLRLAGEINGMKVYLSADLEPSKMLAQNYQSLERLIELVYKPLGQIYGIDPRCLHVFSDTKGPTIAFNRGGTIWLNFRFYLVWHDSDVRAGRMADPLISTYFSMAHELAHNRISSHDAAHGWWTSSIAETYFTKLASYIKQVSPSQVP